MTRQDRTGHERTGQDRTDKAGQERAGHSRTGQHSCIDFCGLFSFCFLLFVPQWLSSSLQLIFVDGLADVMELMEDFLVGAYMGMHT